MARWTGHPEIEKVLQGANAWRQKCVERDGSILTDRSIWTAANIGDVLDRFVRNPIVGSSRDFVDKLSEQLKGAPAASIQLAAEVIWFLFLFPSDSSMKPETKRKTIETIWALSGEQIKSPYLGDEYLAGVGHPGTAYLTHRPAEFEYVLRVMAAFKAKPISQQHSLLYGDPPWSFGEWLDQQEGSDRRLARNVFLYFLFPDDIERNTSRSHRQQIYEAFKNKLPPDKRLRGRRALLDYDRAIREIRDVMEKERKTSHFDFYREDTKGMWFAGYRDGKRKEFTSWLDTFLQDRGLRLNQSGRDTSMEKLESGGAISSETGFWSDESGLTAKPPRWILHVDVTSPQLKAYVPGVHRSRVVGFANTKGGDSGALAVRILAVAKLAQDFFQPITSWEWLLLFCFPGGLKPGSAAQAFDDFDAQTGDLTYMGQKVPYIYLGLLCLNDADEKTSIEVDGKARVVTYREVTQIINNLIHTNIAGGGNA